MNEVKNNYYVLTSGPGSGKASVLNASLAALLLIVFPGLITAQSARNQPNVLFIAVDDLRPELGAYGNKVIKTPNIDRLARSGVMFKRAYVQQALCNPSRASLMTGLRPDTLRVWNLQTEFRQTTPNAITLPQHFMQHGYHTAAIGKIYHNIIPDPQSWSEPELHIEGYPYDPDAVYRHPDNIAIQEARKAEIIKAGRQSRNIDQLGQWYLKANATESVDLPDDVYYDGAQTDVAIKKLAELKARKQPFFFGVGYYRPHLPFNAPKKYWDLYDRNAIPMAANQYVPKDAPLMAADSLRELKGYGDFKQARHPAEGPLSEAEARLLKHGYYASVSYVDAQVGRLMQSLDELGLRDNTIIVLWGDHGWKLGEHNGWGKMTNYEVDTHAPLIICDPRSKAKNVQLNQMVEFVDIYPTLCEMAGLPVPAHLEGLSAVPLFKQPQRPWKKAVFSQFLKDGIWVAPDGIEYMGYSLRTERYRYTQWVSWKTKETAAYELYDHQTDPGENINLAGQPKYKSLLTELEAQRKAGWQSALPIRKEK